MMRLRFFGGFRLESQELTGRAAQRKRLALLAALGTAPGQTLSRDKLISLLWPESSTDRGRHLLASSIYDLRQALGEDALHSVGDDIVLNPTRIDSDVTAFEAALRSGDRESAVALYAGPLLDGFFVTGAPEFEQWVEEKRSRLARQYLKALESLARECEAAGDHRGAVEWWRRRAEAEPLSSSVTLSLMRALEAAGDRAGALRQAEANAALLRAEFGAAPDPAVRELAERMRMQPAATGTDTWAPADSHSQAPADSHSHSPADLQPHDVARPAAADHSPTLVRLPRRRPRVHLAAAVALAVLGAGAVLAARAASTSDDSPIRSIADLPPTDMSGARDADQANPLMEGRRVDPEAYQLYLKGRHAWNRRTKEGLEQAVVLFRRSIDRDPGYAAAHAGLAEAYVLLGYLGFRPGAVMFPKAKAAALRALELDGTIASAYAALGQELSWERDWRGAEDAYRKAILLDPVYATALQWYGGMLSKLGRVDEALVLLRRASELDPLSLQINNNYGMVLCYSGDHAGALAHYRRIVELEPDSSWVRENPWLLSNMARVLSANGLHDEGLEMLATSLQIVPGHPRPLGDVADIYMKLGRPEDAEAAFARADTSNGHYAGYRAILYASRGEADSAFAWYERVRDWGQPLLGDLSMDPRLDPIRDDPRFAALLRELGIGGNAASAAPARPVTPPSPK